MDKFLKFKYLIPLLVFTVPVIPDSNHKKFKNTKKIVITKAKAKTKKISKLKDKKEYYVRIRCYNINENGKKVYSKWSAVKSLKTK